MLGKSLIAGCALLTFLAACSDPPPPNGRGALYVDVGEPTDSQHSGCQFGTHSANIGGDPAQRYPDQYQFGVRVVNGENHASVKCKVKGSGPYTISGRMSLGAVSLTVDGSVPKANFEGGASGKGNVYLLTSPMVGHSIGPIEQDPCTFTPVDVASGKVWSRFDCPVLQANGQQDTYCSATGFFLFENCEQ